MSSNLTSRASDLLGRQIVLRREDNPKRLGSRTRVRYLLYKYVHTTDEFIDVCVKNQLGSHREVISDLKHDSRAGYITIN